MSSQRPARNRRDDRYRGHHPQSQNLSWRGQRSLREGKDNNQPARSARAGQIHARANGRGGQNTPRSGEHGSRSEGVNVSHHATVIHGRNQAASPWAGLGQPMRPNLGQPNGMYNALLQMQQFSAANTLYWNTVAQQQQRKTFASVAAASRKESQYGQHQSWTTSRPRRLSRTQTSDEQTNSVTEHDSPSTPKSHGVPPVEVPIPTPAYMLQAGGESLKAPIRQPLLIILDLNGTLIYRKNRKQPTKFVIRPGFPEFIEKLDRDHTLMIWSSSQPKNVRQICDVLFPDNIRNRLAAVWARDKLGLTPEQYRQKVQVYKRLEQVWADKTIQARYPKKKSQLGLEVYHTLITRKRAAPGLDLAVATGAAALRWDQSNTVLIDDSKLKAAGQPYNILEIPEFTNDRSAEDERRVLATVLSRIEELSTTCNVSRLIRHWDEQGMRISYYDGEKKEKVADIDNNHTIPYPTPVSPTREDDDVSEPSPPSSPSPPPSPQFLDQQHDRLPVSESNNNNDNRNNRRAEKARARQARKERKKAAKEKARTSGNVSGQSS